jgi:7-cyano-7-deazaguanine reductase
MLRKSTQPSMPSRQRQAPQTPPTVPSKALQVFANPAPQRDYLIRFQLPEFTCLCPLTGQPDFAHFSIDIVADQLCVELKSLKLYFWSYRNEGAFHEKVTNTVLDDIVKAVSPRHRALVRAWWYLHRRGCGAPQEGLEAGRAGDAAADGHRHRPERLNAWPPCSASRCSGCPGCDGGR